MRAIERPLTARQLRFLAAFFDRHDPRRTWLCATRAAAAAGYAWPGKAGPRLLTTPAVKAEAERRFAAGIAAMKARAGPAAPSDATRFA